MAARSPPSRWTGLNSGAPDASQSAKAVAPGGISSPHSTTSWRSPAAAQIEQRLALVRRRDHGPRAGVLDDEPDLVRREHDIDRDDDRAGLGDAVVADEPLPAVRAVERNAVARPDARRDKTVRGAIRQCLQVIEGQGAVADQQGRPGPEPLRGDRQDLTDRIRHPGRPFVSSRTVRSAGGTGARAGGEPTRPGACRLDRRARPEDRERGDMLASRWTQVVPPDRPSWRGPSRTGAPACFACTPPVMAGSLACACPAAGSRSAACARCARRPGSVTGSSR